MPDRLPCEFFLVRYVPDPVKGEFTNIGVILREAGLANGAASSPRVRFTRDWSRVRCMDADADIALLEALEAELDLRLREAAGTPKPVLEVMQDSLSNSIQISEPRACLAESVPAELDQLMTMYVESLKVKGPRRRTGRAAIAATMRTQFERAGVWPLLRKRIAAATYTHPGDPMRLDCGYRFDAIPGAAPPLEARGTIRIFQAVSLEGDVELAKVLAYTAPRLRDGVARVESATLDLAAIVEPLRSLGTASDDPDALPPDEIQDRYGFGVATMEEQGIRVLTTSDLARVAETVRHELRL